MKFFRSTPVKVLLAVFFIFPSLVNAGYSNGSSDCQTAPCYNDECCDGGGQFWNGFTIPLVGLLGGIAGGLIGAEIIGSNDGDRGATGPTGPAGPAPFIADSGESLAFTLTALFPLTTPPVVATPFVTSPNGVTYEGPPVTAAAGGGTIIFPVIVITDPVFGFYNFGLSITNGSVTTFAGLSLNGTLVVASRDSSTTSELTPLAGVSIAPGESQISSTFTYGPANVP